MSEADAEAIHHALEGFYTGYSKLVALTLDSLPKTVDADYVLQRIQEKSNVYGSNWSKHSLRWRVKTFAELLDETKPKP